jgi:hypothetical protein
MRKIFINVETGYCGEGYEDVLFVPSQWTDDQIDDYYWTEALDWARQWDHSDEYEDEDNYNENEDLNNRVSFEWEDYDEEKHG